MNSQKKPAVARNLSVAGIVLLSLAMLAFAFLPTHPSHDRAALAAYDRYLKEPTEVNKRAEEEAIDRANRPFHVTQYVSAIGGIVLPILFFIRLRS